MSTEAGDSNQESLAVRPSDLWIFKIRGKNFKSRSFLHGQQRDEFENFEIQ